VTGLTIDLDAAKVEDPAQAWELPTRPPPDGAAPVLAVDGFEGPLDWLLEMARAQRVDLTRLSILALVEAFITTLNAALAQQRAKRVDLTRWGEWLVMAATLTQLRSRLLLPKDAPGARAAQEEAEALRRLMLDRAAMQRAAAWLDRRPQLGREIFNRGGGIESAVTISRMADITDLFRACLIVLRVPDQTDAYQLRHFPFWRVADAVARIIRMLAEPPGGGELGTFLPVMDGSTPERELRCRTALASTFLAGLELAREGALELEQLAPWNPIQLRSPQPPQSV
jgi:segregation and condensation protein A